MKSLQLKNENNSSNNMLELNRGQSLTGTNNKTNCIDNLEMIEAAFIIKEKEGLLENIFNFLPVPLIITRNKNAEIILISAGVETILHINKSEIIGKKINEIIVDNQEYNQLLLQLNLHGKVQNSEIAIRNFHGKSILCLLSIEIIMANEECLHIHSFNNISEIKHLEDAIQNSEDNLRTVFENTCVGLRLPAKIPKISDAKEILTLC